MVGRWVEGRMAAEALKNGMNSGSGYARWQPLFGLALPLHKVFADYATRVAAPDFFSTHILMPRIWESMARVTNERED